MNNIKDFSLAVCDELRSTLAGVKDDQVRALFDGIADETVKSLYAVQGVASTCCGHSACGSCIWISRPML